MATIVLSPKESFEHYHEGETISALVEGFATITIGNVTKEMKPGEKINIPVGTRHIMKNIGATEAKIMCSGH